MFNSIRELIILLILRLLLFDENFTEVLFLEKTKAKIFRLPKDYNHFSRVM